MKPAASTHSTRSETAPGRQQTDPLSFSSSDSGRNPAATALVCSAWSAPRVDVIDALELWPGGARFVFRANSADWTFSGQGSCVRLTAAGEDRFSNIARDAKRVFASLAYGALAEGALESGGPRFFGGASFSPKPETLGTAWQGFANTEFILPRWMYSVGAQQAFLWLCVTNDEWNAARGTLTQEAETLRAALASQARSRPPKADASMERKAKVTLLPPSGFLPRVEVALAAIARGDLEKVVVARTLTLGLNPVPVTAHLLKRLSELEPLATQFLFENGGAAWLGATPERLCAIAGDRFSVDALAGSLPVSAGDPQQLLASAKDRYEHRLVVEGIERALRALFMAEVNVPSQPAVRQQRSVYHLHTPISGRLSSPVHILEMVAALHPTAAVCGSPTQAAQGFIDRTEGHERGWYASPFGHFDREGAGGFVVGLRSALLREGSATLFAGCGIVKGSELKQEDREYAAKLETMLHALGARLR